MIFYGFGGTHEKNMRARVIPPFEKKHGVKVTYVTGTSHSNFAKVRAQKDRPEGDVLWTNDVLHVTVPYVIRLVSASLAGFDRTLELAAMNLCATPW